MDVWTSSYGLMDTYYIQWIMIHYCHVFECLVTSGVSYILLMCCYYFLPSVTDNIPDSSCAFPVQALASAISSSILGSF